jgi:hypothetical protein
MFKNLIAAALFIFALALIFGDPKSWHWYTMAGPWAVHAMDLIVQFRPFAVTIFIAVAILLFMSKKQY